MKSAGKNHPWKRFFVGGVVLCVPITVLIASLLLRAPLKKIRLNKMNQNPSCRLLYTDASNTGEFLQSEIPGVLLARQHGKENHWEDVTS